MIENICEVPIMLFPKTSEWPIEATKSSTRITVDSLAAFSNRILVGNITTEITRITKTRLFIGVNPQKRQLH